MAVDVRLIVTDAPPLITLAVAKSLINDYLDAARIVERGRQLLAAR
jgi:hypothetical protein